MTRKPVTLPLPPWEVDARLARPDLAAADIDEPSGGDDGKRRTRRVWKIGDAPVFSALPSDCRMALDLYRDAFERVGASSGTLDPSTSTGPRPMAPEPSLGKVDDARRLRQMEAALFGHSITLSIHTEATLTYGQIAHAVAIRRQTTADLLRSVGIDKPSARQRRVMVATILDVAQRLAACCGLARYP